MRFLLLLVGSALWLAGPAAASTISVALATDNSFCSGAEGSSCYQDDGLFGYDAGMQWNTVSGGTSAPVAGPPSTPGLGSTSTTFQINGVAAVDGGGDRTVTAHLNFDITLSIDVDYEVTQWTVDLNQSVLGLFGLRGDGTATAVGTQQSGSASISTIGTTVDGNPFNFAASPTSYANNPSNNGSASQQFSGSRVDGGVLSGTGDQVVTVNIDIDLSAFTNDGCSGFICSSISGGEEAAVLFGDQSAMDQAVDDYGTWGRALGPDGYNSTFTLNVTVIPEPATALLLGAGLVGIGALQRRRRA